MQTPRRVFVVVLATLALSASLVAGCGSSKPAAKSGPLPDAATLLKESAQTTRKLNSVHLVLTVNGTVKGLSIKSLTGDLTNTPAVAAKGHVELSDLAPDFVVIDGILYAKLTGDQWTDLGKAADIYDVSVILNPETGLANVLANFSDPKAEGREIVDGVQTVKVTGQVSSDAVRKIVPTLTGGPVPGTAWIREDGDHDLVQAKLEPSPGNSIQMTLSDWNKPVTVTKPAGV